MLIFVAAQAPELVSRDLRSHVLPLYNSRPLRRLDYPLAKYPAFTAACLLLVEIPLIILYLGTIVSAGGGSAVWDQTKALIPGLGVAALMAVLLAAIGLLLASLTGRRAYATGVIAIYFFLTWILARILVNVASHGAQPPPGPWPRTRARAGGGELPARRPTARPDKPVHRCRWGAAMAGWHESGSHSESRQCGRGVWPDVRAVARDQPGRPGRPVPEGRCVVTAIELRNVSRWYGNVVAINDITVTIGPGVTGLLGPNGAASPP